MAYFPLFVSLEGKQCLVVGGGKVAFRKAKVLLEYGVRLRVVAEKFCPEMQALAEKKEGCCCTAHAEENKQEDEWEAAVKIFCRKAKVNDAEGMDFVICASGDGELHREMAAYCREHRIPVNLADNREESTFLFPALVRQKDVVLGITTGGNSPAASRYLREFISEQLPEGIGNLVQQLGKLRSLVKETLPEQRLREEVFTRLFFHGLENGGELREEDVRQIYHKMKEKTDEMNTKIRIGTRSSDLSVAQTMLVIKAIQGRFPGTETEMVCRRTIGDKILDKPLQAFGGKGVFVSEFEEALLNGEIDFAVHSAKDLPLELADGLEIVGVLSRGDVRDVLVTLNENHERIQGSEAGSSNIDAGKKEENRVITIGTSSLRRKIQIEELAEKLWPGRNAVCEILRGNVLTRLKRLEQGDYDAVLLAAAGLERLGIFEKKRDMYHFHYLSEEEMIPAAGQGILAVEGRKDEEKNRFVREISDPEAMMQLWMERRVIFLLNAGCHEPVGVYSRIDQEKNELCLTGIYEKDGKRRRVKVKKRLVQADETAAGQEKVRRMQNVQKVKNAQEIPEEQWANAEAMEEAAWEMACKLAGGEENLPGWKKRKGAGDE